MMNINPLLNQIALTTGPTVELPDGTRSRNIRYYLPILEQAGQDTGSVYVALLELYDAATTTPAGVLPSTPGDAVALSGAGRVQLDAATSQLNLFGVSNSGVAGTDTATMQALSTQLVNMAGYISGPTGIFERTADAVDACIGGSASVTNLNIVRTAIGTVADTVVATVSKWGAVCGIWSLAAPSTVAAVNGSFTIAQAATQAVIDAQNGLTTQSTGDSSAVSTPESVAFLTETTALLLAIRNYVNANTGATITGSGAPFATLEAWAVAQGIIPPP